MAFWRGVGGDHRSGLDQDQGRYSVAGREARGVDDGDCRRCFEWRWEVDSGVQIRTRQAAATVLKRDCGALAVHNLR